MLFDRVVGNLRSEEPLLIDDNLDLSWQACFRRASRQTTRGGKQVRLLLPLGTWLRQGDVITDGAARLAIHVVPCDVLVVRPTDAKLAAMIALGLGNLHAPVQCGDGELVTLPDGPIEQLLTQLGAIFQRGRRRFEPETVAAPIRAQLAADFQIWPGSVAVTSRVGKAAVAEPLGIFNRDRPAGPQNGPPFARSPE